MCAVKVHDQHRVQPYEEKEVQSGLFRHLLNRKNEQEKERRIVMKSIDTFWRKRIIPFVFCFVMLAGVVVPATAAKYYSSYNSLEKARNASAEINLQIAEESVVLMKNQNNVLPFKNVRFVSVFGKAAEDPFYAGGGSGTAQGYYGKEYYVSIYNSLETAGYSVNPALRAFYEKEVNAVKLTGGADFNYQIVDGKVVFSGNRAEICDTSPNAFTGAVLDSYARYSDAAIIVLGRTGSEGGDRDMGRTREAFIAEEYNKAFAAGTSQAELDILKASLENALDNDPEFAANALRHGLQLTWEEEQLIKHPYFITRLQHRPGARIMRRADGIKSRFFQQTDFAPLGVRIRARAQQTVVVVHAGAAQHGELSIDAQSVPGVTLYGANAETDLLLVLPETDTAKIALGRFRRPKFHIRQRI